MDHQNKSSISDVGFVFSVTGPVFFYKIKECFNIISETLTYNTKSWKNYKTETNTYNILSGDNCTYCNSSCDQTHRQIF